MAAASRRIADVQNQEKLYFNALGGTVPTSEVQALHGIGRPSELSGQSASSAKRRKVFAIQAYGSQLLPDHSTGAGPVLDAGTLQRAARPFENLFPSGSAEATA